jgi:hypothetical protein
MALTTNIGVSVNAQLVTALDLGNASFPLAVSKRFAWASGSGANQALKIFSDQRTVATTETLDLAGTLVDALGVTLTFATVKLLYFFAAAANAGNLSVGGGNWSAWTGAAGDLVLVQPGGVFLLTAPGAGFTVTATSADVLTVAGTNALYDVVIIGT